MKATNGLPEKHKGSTVRLVCSVFRVISSERSRPILRREKDAAAAAAVVATAVNGMSVRASIVVFFLLNPRATKRDTLEALFGVSVTSKL